MDKERTFGNLFYNVITYSGVLLSLVVLVAELFLFAADFASGGSHMYLQLVTYLILPGFLFIGLLLIPIGYFWKKRRIRRGAPTFELRNLRIDLALRHHRNALLVFIIGTSLLVLMSLVGSYQAFHYTESVSFCGTLCHEVMKPEYTAYTNSPHGRVKCVECHIGAGAGWYVKSKASGLRQVYRTLLNSFHRPIATPIHNLRPAEETCKQCHWPGKFFGAVDFQRTYFLQGDESKQWNLRLLLNVGGGGEQSYGIHAHMNLASEISYVADDERRQKISWVRAVDKNGRETIYYNEESKYKDEIPPAEAVRTMDCVDCHNRPSHQFRPPFRLMNTALSRKEIDSQLPEIKRRGVEALAKGYATSKEAEEGISKSLHDFYEKQGPDFMKVNSGSVDRAVKVITGLYQTNMFPEMKARWDAFPDHIGHMYSPGCFRCHDGEHKSKEGKAITHDCKSCHLIVAQGEPGEEEKSLDGLKFKHPDGSTDWKTTPCTDCHTGAD